MDYKGFHNDILVIDGLNISRWNREIFEDMRKGGLDVVQCTCSIWDNFKDTMNNIALWKQWFKQNNDIIIQVYSTDDIVKAKEQGKTGIILGFQNTSAFEDQLSYVSLFYELGVRVVQMCYNTQNLSGSGCYEEFDGGLSGFGRELVSTMNESGMVIDLSHVGINTSSDVIQVSKEPVCFSHTIPFGLKKHPRNRTDKELENIVEKGGFVGATFFPPLLPNGTDSTVDDLIAVIQYLIDLLGEDNVGIGTDFTQGYGDEFFHSISHDKGYARKLVEFGSTENPDALKKIRDFPNLTVAMLKAGWPRELIKKIMGNNWFDFYKKIWK
jgi:membrane dipeptidase